MFLQSITRTYSDIPTVATPFNQRSPDALLGCARIKLTINLGVADGVEAQESVRMEARPVVVVVCLDDSNIKYRRLPRP